MLSPLPPMIPMIPTTPTTPTTSMRRSYAWPSLLLLAAACNIAVSEDGSLDLRTQPLFYSEVEPPSSGSRVLQGSQACLEIDSVLVEDGEDGTWWTTSSFDSCYDITLNGAPVRDGECVVLDELGEALYEYTPLTSCPAEDFAPRLVPDRYRLQVTAAAELGSAGLEWYNERSAERYLHPGPRGSFPSDWTPLDEPLQLVPGVLVPFPVMLLDRAGERVAWDLEQGQVLESRDGGAARPLASIPDYDGYFPVSVPEGGRSTLSLSLPEVELPVAELVAAPADAAASLEIVVAYGTQEDTDPWTAPLGARAVVRDAEGRIILGAPVQWTLVEGHLSMGPLNDEIGIPPEYLALGDDCEPPPTTAPQSRRATLRAELGELGDELELEWTALPDEEPSDEPFEPNVACRRGGEDEGLGDRGCGCTTNPGSQGARWLAWGVVLLGLVARRRRAHGAPRAAIGPR